MDNQGLLQSMAHLLAAGGTGGGSVPSLASQLLPQPIAPTQPQLDPQATAMFNARLEMLNALLINQLMSVAGVPVPPPPPAPTQQHTVAPRHIGERTGGNTVAPPSIMRQQARREREALQRQQMQSMRDTQRQNRCNLKEFVYCL